MQKNKIKHKEQLHHAYIVEGDHSCLSNLYTFVNELFGFSQNHPDIFFHGVDSFGVEDANIIINKNYQKPQSGQDKIIICLFNKISHQAQNNLLKTLEEPTTGTYIFLISPTASVFLPTVMSRVHRLNDLLDFENDELEKLDDEYEKKVKHKSGKLSVVENINKEKTEERKLALKFIKSSIPERLEIVKKILEDKKDEKIDDGYIFGFIKEIQLQLHDFSTSDISSLNKNNKIFIKISDYLYDSSASKKLILEYIALGIEK